MLERDDPVRCQDLARRLEHAGYHLRLTRDLDAAREYLWERYRENPDARFGLLASSRDRALGDFGIANDYQATKRTRFGPWYGDGEESDASCRHLRDVVTEFGAQGLELDAVLLAWGTDFAWQDDHWSNARASGYRGSRVRDAFQLRLNSYRVLLTRARDVNVVFVPPLPELESTARRLLDCGFASLT